MRRCCTCTVKCFCLQALIRRKASSDGIFDAHSGIESPDVFRVRGGGKTEGENDVALLGRLGRRVVGVLAVGFPWVRRRRGPSSARSIPRRSSL